MLFSKQSIDDILNSSATHDSSFYQSINFTEANRLPNADHQNQKFGSVHESMHLFKEQPSQIQSSCPADVFKNYSNVFAEITKAVIGDIEDSDDSVNESSIMIKHS